MNKTDLIEERAGSGLDGFQLKLLALLSMFIDHFAAIVLEQYLSNAGVVNLWESARNFGEPAGRLAACYLLMRLVGRLAFPIYCFFIVEGFFHTSRLPRYLLRLLIFAFLSEVPFDLAFEDRWFYPGYQNVYFTLLIGLLTISGIHRLVQTKIPRALGVLTCTFAGAAAAELLHTDYGAIGVCVIVILYCGHGGSRKRSMGLSCLALLFTSYMEVTALVDVWLVNRYNGKRGRSLKYFFYGFYPAHILSLYLLRLWISSCGL
jgi:hypothetical protein